MYRLECQSPPTGGYTFTRKNNKKKTPAKIKKQDAHFPKELECMSGITLSDMSTLSNIQNCNALRILRQTATGGGGGGGGGDF